MAVKLSIVVLMCFLVSVHARNIIFDTETNVDKRTLNEWYKSSCSRKEQKICERRDESWCHIPTVRLQCPRLCGECALFTDVCPSNYVFGCCWDGAESLTPDKSDCPSCEDTIPTACARWTIKKDCDRETNSRETRRLCPITCGACHDFGN